MFDDPKHDEVVRDILEGWLEDDRNDGPMGVLEDYGEYDDSMDGDHESALASAGFGTDEDYGCYNSCDPCGEGEYDIGGEG